MRNRSLINPADGGEFTLGETCLYPQASNVPVDGPKHRPGLTSTFLSHDPLDDIFSTGSQALEKKSLPRNVISGGYMTGARHPKPYVKKPRKQMTRAWKERVLARLEENDAADRMPRNPAELARMLKADKAGMYATFDLERDPPQMSSSYVDAICDLLDIGPPMVESNEDAELEADLEIIRHMPADARRDLMVIARRMPKR
jgi:hypothetical protein